MLMADAIHAGLAGRGSALVRHLPRLRKPPRPSPSRRCGRARWLQLPWFSACVLRRAFLPRTALPPGRRDFAVVAGVAVLAAARALSAAAIAAAPLARTLRQDRGCSSTAAGDSSSPRCGLLLRSFAPRDLAFHSLRLRRLWKRRDSGRGRREPSLPAGMLYLPRGTSQICTTRDLDRPSVIGFLAPRILIPDGSLARLTPGELEQVVLHEAEHLRRRDDWTNLLQKLLLVLFPLNPALAWMERRLCREREMACDEGVVRRTQAPRAYAACLTSSRRARTATTEFCGARRRFRWARSSAAGAGSPRAQHPVAQTRAASAGGSRAGWRGGMRPGVGSVELARCPQLVAFVADAEAAMRRQRARAAIARAARHGRKPHAVFRPCRDASSARSSARSRRRPFCPHSRKRAALTPAASRPRRSDDSSAASNGDCRSTGADTGAARAEMAKAIEPTSATDAAQAAGVHCLHSLGRGASLFAKDQSMVDYEAALE